MWKSFGGKYKERDDVGSNQWNTDRQAQTCRQEGLTDGNSSQESGEAGISDRVLTNYSTTNTTIQ